MAKAKTTILGVSLSALLGFGGGGAALACAFHGYMPRQTLIDILLETDRVVIARPDTRNQNRYAPIETLSGPEVSEIPIDVDAETRNLLAKKPSSTVLLVRDGSYGPWLAVAVLDSRYSAFLTKVLRQKSGSVLWDDTKRLRLFVSLLNDKSPAIRGLALQELDRAAYADVKNLRLPKIENLRQDLETSDDAVKPILILLAGLSGDRSLGPVLWSKMGAAIHNDVPYLGAYATALIELEGKPAVEAILHEYLRSRTLSMTTKEKLLQAFALQYKTAPRATRRAISLGAAELVRDAPELADIAARQFGFRLRSQSSPKSDR